MPLSELAREFLTTTLADPDAAREVLAELDSGGAAGLASAAVESFGARGDGVTDDGPAFLAALAALSAAGGGTLLLGPKTYKVVQTAGNVYLGVPANTTVRGTAGRTKVNFYSDVAAGDSAYREGWRVLGDNVILQGLVCSRANSFLCVMFKVGASAGFTLRDVEGYGSADLYAGQTHGVEFLASAGTFSGVRLDHVHFHHYNYGLFQTNESTNTVRNVVVTGSRFHHNYADDLQFNSPSGTCTDLTVTDCFFSDNQAAVQGFGFGVGFANCQRCSVTDCRFTGYNLEAIHIEDRNRQVTISGCSFLNCAALNNNVIQIIDDSHEVSILGCHFDQRAAVSNPNSSACVFVSTGGNFPTADRTTIVGNTFLCGSVFNGVNAFAVQFLNVANNVFEAAGSVAGGVFSGHAGFAFSPANGQFLTFNNNLIVGFQVGVNGSGSTFRTGGLSVVTGNIASNCSDSFNLTPNAAGLVLTQNVAFNCVNAPVFGSNGLTSAQQCLAAHNVAVGCTNAMTNYGAFFSVSAPDQRHFIFGNCDDSLGAAGWPTPAGFLGNFGPYPGGSGEAAPGAYNTAHLVMGGYHFWVDSADQLRIKSGAPASALDGAVVPG